MVRAMQQADRAVLGTLIYTEARVGAIAQLRLQDLTDLGDHRVIRFSEKGGKQRGIPLRHDLDSWLRAYLDAARIEQDPKDAPLFRASWKNQRRLNNAGLPEIISPHSFRVMVVTDLLSQNVPMEDVQYLAGHTNPRTTQIYDRRKRRITRNIVERISV